MTDTAAQYRNDPQMRAVQLGIDTVHFIENDKVGQYLVERAHQCRVNALEQLAGANPEHTEVIRCLQWEAKIPDLFLTWLDEAIAMGKASEESIRIEEGFEL